MAETGHGTDDAQTILGSDETWCNDDERALTDHRAGDD